MSVRKLYHLPFCPFSRKVRLALAEKKLDFELVEENPFERRDAFAAMNPAIEVPVLQEKEGQVIADSQVICEWLEERFSDVNLIGKTAAERAEIRRLMAWFDKKFHQEVTRNLLFERYLKRVSGGGGPHSDCIRAGKQNILYHLDYIAYLTQQRNWLAGDRLSLADLAAAAHLSALDYFGDVPWEYNREAKEWYALIKSRPCMRPLLLDRVPAFKPPPHYDDLDF